MKLEEFEIINVKELSSYSCDIDKSSILAFFDKIKSGCIQRSINEACIKGNFEVRNPFGNSSLTFLSSRSVLNKYNIVKACDENACSYIVFQWVGSFDAILNVSKKTIIVFSHFNENVLAAIFNDNAFLDLIYDNSVRKFSGIIVSHERPYHYFYDILPNFNASGLSKLDDISIFSLQGGDFIDLKTMFNTVGSVETILSSSLNKIGDNENKFFIKIGAFSDKDFVRNKADIEEIDAVFNAVVNGNSVERSGYINICINISDHKRKLTNINELVFDVVNYYLSSGLKVCIFFDGWTRPISPLNPDLVAIEKEKKLAEEIVKILPEEVEYSNLIGKTFLEKLNDLSACDLYFGCIATASIIPSRILNIRSLCHFNHLFTDDIYILGKNAHVIPKQIVFPSKDESTIDLYRVDYSIPKDLFYEWFLSVVSKPLIDLTHELVYFEDASTNKNVDNYVRDFSSAVLAYNQTPNNRNAGMVARCFLDNKMIDLCFRSKIFLNFIIDLENLGRHDLAVKMSKHLLNSGAYNAAVQYLLRATSGSNKTIAAVNELKNIYYREAINYWRTGRTLYGLDSLSGDLYSSTYKFIKFIKKHRETIDFNDFSVVSQVTNAFLMLSTNGSKVLSIYVDDLLNFVSELFSQGFCDQITLDLVYYDIFVWFGHFTVANTYRQRAVRQCIDSFNLNNNAIEVFLAHAEIGLEVPKEKLEELQSAMIKATNPNYVKSFFKYYGLNVSSNFEFEPGTKVVSAFGEFIKGKSVAIVGPCDDGCAVGDAIDKFDVVIRINNFRDIEKEEQKYIGKRTDVGYFTHQMISSMTSVDDLKDIKFVRLRNGLGKVANSVFSDMVTSGRISPANLIIRQFYKGASVIQTIIFDILDFNPSVVKLFKMNFYLEKELYSKSYKENISLVYSNYSNAGDIHSYRSVCFAHDFLPQFLFTKNLYKLGYIDAQDNIKEILELSPAAYMQNMQYSHRNESQKLLTALKYIPAKPVTVIERPMQTKVKGKLTKEVKAALRIFDFATAYDKLRQIGAEEQANDAVTALWKTFDFNLLVVSSLFQRNWNVIAEAPRSLTWNDIEKIYNVDNFSEEDKMLFFMQASEQKEFISGKDTVQFIQNNLKYLYEAVGDVSLNICPRSGYKPAFEFKHLPVSVKQALARYDLLQWFGDFSGAFSQRLAALNLVNSTLSDSASLAALERSGSASNLVSQINTGNVEFDALLNGNYELFLQGFKTLREEEVVLCELIQGKSVAIVGPAPTGEASGAEIDGFDVVIRFNYTGTKFDAEFGSKTTVSAYNKINSIYFEQFKVDVPFNKLAFYFVKEPVKNFSVHKENADKVGVLPRIPFLMHKTPMATVDVLYHVLKFKPRKVKVFKHTLLISSKTHADSYGFRRDFNSNVLSPLQKLRMTISGHDLLSHHSLLKHLYKLNLFEADVAFDKVLSMSTQAFSDELQQIYGQ